MIARVKLRDNFEVITTDIPEVNIFWGTSDIDKSKVSTFDAEYIGELIWDDSFDLAPNQQWLDDLCASLATEDFIIIGTVDCWIEKFREDRSQDSLAFPVPEADFVDAVEAWLLTDTDEDTGKTGGLRYKNNVGIIDGKIVFTSISGTPEIDDSEPYAVKKPEYDKW